MLHGYLHIHICNKGTRKETTLRSAEKDCSAHLIVPMNYYSTGIVHFGTLVLELRINKLFGSRRCILLFCTFVWYQHYNAVEAFSQEDQSNQLQIISYMQPIQTVIKSVTRTFPPKLLTLAFIFTTVSVNFLSTNAFSKKLKFETKS